MSCYPCGLAGDSRRPAALPTHVHVPASQRERAAGLRAAHASTIERIKTPHARSRRRKALAQPHENISTHTHTHTRARAQTRERTRTQTLAPTLLDSTLWSAVSAAEAVPLPSCPSPHARLRAAAVHPHRYRCPCYPDCRGQPTSDPKSMEELIFFDSLWARRGPSPAPPLSLRFAPFTCPSPVPPLACPSLPLPAPPPSTHCPSAAHCPSTAHLSRARSKSSSTAGARRPFPSPSPPPTAPRPPTYIESGFRPPPPRERGGPSLPLPSLAPRPPTSPESGRSPQAQQTYGGPFSPLRRPPLPRGRPLPRGGCVTSPLPRGRTRAGRPARGAGCAGQRSARAGLRALRAGRDARVPTGTRARCLFPPRHSRACSTITKGSGAVVRILVQGRGRAYAHKGGCACARQGGGC